MFDKGQTIAICIRPLAAWHWHGVWRVFAGGGAVMSAGCAGVSFPGLSDHAGLRHSYDVTTLRQVLFWSMVISGGIALYNIILPAGCAGCRPALFCWCCWRRCSAGTRCQSTIFPITPYIGLDWFILDLLGSSLIFIFIENCSRCASRRCFVRSGRPICSISSSTTWWSALYRWRPICWCNAVWLGGEGRCRAGKDPVRGRAVPDHSGGGSGGNTGRTAPITKYHCFGACTRCITV